MTCKSLQWKRKGRERVGDKSEHEAGYREKQVKQESNGKTLDS